MTWSQSHSYQVTKLYIEPRLIVAQALDQRATGSSASRIWPYVTDGGNCRYAGFSGDPLEPWACRGWGLPCLTHTMSLLWSIFPAHSGS